MFASLFAGKKGSKEPEFRPLERVLEEDRKAFVESIRMEKVLGSVKEVSKGSSFALWASEKLKSDLDRFLIVDEKGVVFSRLYGKGDFDGQGRVFYPKGGRRFVNDNVCNALGCARMYEVDSVEKSFVLAADKDWFMKGLVVNVHAEPLVLLEPGEKPELLRGRVVLLHRERVYDKDGKKYKRSDL